MFRLRQTGVGEPQSQLRNKSCIHSGRWRPKLCFVAFWFMISSFVSSVITRRDSIIPLKQSDFMLESHKSKRNKELPAFLLYSFSNNATYRLTTMWDRKINVRLKSSTMEQGKWVGQMLRQQRKASSWVISSIRCPESGKNMDVKLQTDAFVSNIHKAAACFVAVRTLFFICSLCYWLYPPAATF